ncbi:MAG: hypothetical protein GX790_05080, partial [Syntrophomonadaceae bacterium]|nr:hypothetical protein [Syntrophomonadaceae bacterium]
AMEDIVGIDINSSEDLIETIIRDRDITLASDDIKLPIEDENIDDINFAIKDNIIEEMKAELNNESVEENSVIEDSELTKGVEETAAIAAEQETLAIETPETDNSVIVIENEEIKSQEELNEELISYINDAFKYKTEGNDEKAIEKFLLIWENTKDYDLKHLVTLELVQMYKTAGLYTSAQELLTLFYEEIKEINIFLASQLNQELTYINLLLSEIERLGLEQVPFDKLPRWVKIKVADELNQLE